MACDQSGKGGGRDMVKPEKEMQLQILGDLKKKLEEKTVKVKSLIRCVEGNGVSSVTSSLGQGVSAVKSLG